MIIPQYPNVKILGFAGFSGSGKTTLLSRVMPILNKHGLRLAIIKHSHHDFEIDQPGKDSYRLHHAGSRQTLLISPYRCALIKENALPEEPGLEQALQELDGSQLDLVLVEGFRQVAELDRIEIHRPELGKPLLCEDQPKIIAVATNQPIEVGIPVLDLNQPAIIAEFILQWVNPSNLNNDPESGS